MDLSSKEIKLVELAKDVTLQHIEVGSGVDLKFFIKKAASAALTCAKNIEGFNFAASNQATDKNSRIRVF